MTLLTQLWRLIFGPYWVAQFDQHYGFPAIHCRHGNRERTIFVNSFEDANEACRRINRGELTADELVEERLLHLAAADIASRHHE